MAFSYAAPSLEGQLFFGQVNFHSLEERLRGFQICGRFFYFQATCYCQIAIKTGQGKIQMFFNYCKYLVKPIAFDPCGRSSWGWIACLID